MRVRGALAGSMLLLALFGCSDDPPALAPVSFDAGCRDCAPPPVVCDAPMSACGGSCVDLQGDPLHCGSCETSCGEGGSCAAGACRCGAGTSLCRSVSGVEECADLDISSTHCGACGTRCAAGGSCVAGACTCPMGRVACEGADGRATCVDLATSVLHCGACGAACPSTFDCVGGACECMAGRTACTGPERCADVRTDDQHCGACGIACAPGQLCEAGRCVGECAVGDVCTTSSDCRSGPPAMLPESAGAVCTAETRETVTVDGVTWSEVRSQGGYCYGSFGYEGSANRCEPGSNRGCDACADCVRLGVDAMLGVLTACVQRCELSVDDWATTRSGCREGYQCEIEREVCSPGCASDEQCRATWRDLDRDDVHDDGETTYDTASSATCNLPSGRCVNQPFDPDAQVGDPCTSSLDCGRDGYCLPGWPGGGYCTKLGCTLVGRACEPGSVCQPYYVNRNGTCLSSCVFGDETDPAQILGVGGGDPDCRVPGYACSTVDGSAFGGCIAGGYSDVTEPNLGEACETNADCYSPYGVGACATTFGVKWCTLIQCGSSPFGHDGPTRSELCPEGSTCVGDPRVYTQCLRNCDPALGGADCPPSHACTSMGEPRTPVCFPRCRDDADCGGRDRCLEGACRRP